jgi:hypothetical protein
MVEQREARAIIRIIHPCSADGLGGHVTELRAGLSLPSLRPQPSPTAPLGLSPLSGAPERQHLNTAHSPPTRCALTARLYDGPLGTLGALGALGVFVCFPLIDAADALARVFLAGDVLCAGDVLTGEEVFPFFDRDFIAVSARALSGDV